MATIDLTQNGILRLKETGGSVIFANLFNSIRKKNNKPWDKTNRIDSIDAINQREDNWFNWFKFKNREEEYPENFSCIRCGAPISNKPWKGYAELCDFCDEIFDINTPWMSASTLNSQEERSMSHNSILNNWLINGI